MGAAPPWGQSLLRSYLAPHSFPPPPPAYVLSALGTVVALVALTPKGVGVVAVDHHLELRRQVWIPISTSPSRVNPLHPPRTPLPTPPPPLPPLPPPPP